MPGTLKLLSTLAVQGAMPELISRFEHSSGMRIAADFGPTNDLVPRITSGEPADAAILTAQSVDELSAKGLLEAGSAIHIATSLVGIAVKAGARKPDIGSVEAFRKALLQASSIGYSRAGASGVFFAGLIRRLGIENEVNAKARVKPTGFTAELAASGEVEIAVQQLSELKMVPGIEIVGPLPAEIQSVTRFSGAVLANAAEPHAARRLLHYLVSPEATLALEKSGLEP